MVTHKMSGNGMKQVTLKAISGISNCPSHIIKTVKIFPKKLANLDLSKIKDTLQCFDGNYFEGRTTPIMAPFPMGVTYAWHTGDGQVSNFQTLRKTYDMSGRFRVMLVLNATSFSQPTGCFDTMYFTIAVKPDPRKNLRINSDTQYIDTNFFRFENFDTAIASQTWYFGDGDSSALDSCSHSYADTGNFKLILRVKTKDGCVGDKEYLLRVFDTAKLSGINELQTNKLRLFPNPAHTLLNVHLDDYHPNDVLLIIDIQGRVLKKIALNSSDINIDISDLNNGIYVVRIEREGEMIGKGMIRKE